MLGNNPHLDCDVKLDTKLMETDQIFTPWLPWAVPNRIDGVWFDDWGNPTFFDVLRWHPGGVFPYWTWLYDTVPAQYIVQLMRRDRPNQHRGMSAFTPSLRLFAQRKRFLEAVIKAAESHAWISILLETLQPPQFDEMTPARGSARPRSPRTWSRRIPWGYKASGFKAEQPATTFEMFDRRLIAAIARPWSMPYAIAACDSSKTNFSSGRLDHQTYFSMIRVDQRLVARTVCTRVLARVVPRGGAGLRLEAFLAGAPRRRRIPGISSSRSIATRRRRPIRSARNWQSALPRIRPY